MLIALDIDGTLIDTSQSFTRIVRELSGATDAEIRRFRDTGAFNDDWELARAATAWVRAGRGPCIEEMTSWRRAIALCGYDPGDLSATCAALYHSGYHRAETPLVDAGLLDAVAARHRVAACTGRDLPELALAEALLGFTFSAKTTMETFKKPDPRALLSLVQPDERVVALLGDTAADAQCVENAARARPDVRFAFFAIGPAQTARAILEALLGADDPEAFVLARASR